MKFQIIILAASLISAVPAFGSELCVSREENNGVINIRKVEITANGKRLFSLIGGERKCAEVKPGNYIIYAQSSNPFEKTDENKKAWVSKPLKILVASKKKVTIAVEPVFRGAEYVGPWLLKKIPFNQEDSPDPKPVR